MGLSGCHCRLADGNRAYRWRVHGVFSTRADLRDFPFDRTELQIRVSASRGVNMLRLVENKVSPSIVQSSNFMLDNVWTLQPIAVFEAGVSHASQSRSGTSRPLAIVKLYIDRKSQYYLVQQSASIYRYVLCGGAHDVPWTHVTGAFPYDG